MERKKQVLSGIQPTGEIHFGNYFGAVKNWVDLQADYDCVFGIVDYHALTMPFSAKKLREDTWNLAFNLIAVGVDTDNLFIQSLIPEHAELCWIMNCFASYGYVTRMTQFKDKSNQLAENSKTDFVSVGLFDYPVLQAADILIYRADYVPVGKDQEQHLELTRVIAQRFNHVMKKEFFKLPESLYTETPKIRSTADPERKMSKSAGEKHYISIFSEEAALRKKIRSAVTDTGEESGSTMSPGVENLFELLKASERMDAYNHLMNDYHYGTLKYQDLKEAVADGLVALTEQFRENRKELLENKREIKERVKASSEVIRKTAQETTREIKELVGLLNVKY
jgi:tryptophanyl-tRNA synthetase